MREGRRDADELLLTFDRGPVVRDRLLARHVSPVIDHLAPRVDDRVRRAAMRTWEDRARSEYTGVMLMRRFHELTIDLNAPMDVQELALRLAVSEQEHAAMCIDAARSLGSSGELAFDEAELSPTRGADPEESLIDTLVGLFLVGEVVALDLLSCALSLVPPSSYRGVLERIARDEVAHARVGRVLLRSLRDPEARWAPYPGDDEVAKVARRHVATMYGRDVVHASDVELSQSPSARAELASLGVPPPEELRARHRSALESLVPRELLALGIGSEGD